MRNVAPTSAETDADARSECLGLQGLVDRSSLRTTTHKIENGLCGPECVRASAGNETDDFCNRRVIEACSNAQAVELGQHIDLGGPVFEPLKIAVEPAADIGTFLVHDHRCASGSSCNGGAQSCRPRSDNLNDVLCQCHDGLKPGVRAMYLR